MNRSVARLAVFGLTACALATLLASSQGASPAPPFSSVPVEEIVLDNGFRVLVVEDRRVPRIAANLSYRIGALQELTGEHGSTHFLEHAAHQGTPTVGTTNFEAEKPILKEIYDTEQQLIEARNDDRNQLRERRVFFDELDWPSSPAIDRLRRRLYELEDKDAQYRDFWAEYKWYRRYGGLMRHTDPVPATTGNEYLEIDVDLPRENIELFFRLEADRLANAVLRGWEAQRFTVLEQILNRWSRPETRFVEALQGVSGQAHPTYKLSAWGHLRDFAYFSRANMLQMQDSYFVPNNATLALVGDIAPGDARAFAARYFGRIPRGPSPPARMDLEAEPPPGGAVRLDWSEPLEPRVIVRFHIPGIGHPDRPVFDTIAALLTGRRGLVAGKLANGRSIPPAAIAFQANASRSGSPGTITLSGTPQRDEDVPVAERALLDAVEDLRQGRIDPDALARARKALRVDWEQIRSTRHSLAYELGTFHVMDSWATLQRHMEARLRVSVEDIQKAAQQYFVPSNRVIGTSRRKPM
jgi:predicted Zn-dependent peptidase